MILPVGVPVSAATRPMHCGANGRMRSMPDEATTPETSEQAVRQAVDKLLQSEQFRSAARASRLLRFLVETALDGRSEQLKEYVLGVEVFDRGAAFDSTVDTIVRVEASKLRKRLDAYYRGPGRKDDVIIAIPKGTYVPEFRHRPRRDPPKNSVVRNRPFSVHILPFANGTSDADDHAWSEGLRSELMLLLSRSTRLRVVSHALDAPASDGSGRSGIRSQRADLLLQCSVQRHPAGVRVIAHVTDSVTGTQIWSAAYDRSISDPGAMQESIARPIVDDLLLTLADNQHQFSSRRHSTDCTAFEPFLRGCRHLARFTVASQVAALQQFELALAAQADYPLASLATVRTLLNLTTLGVKPPMEVLCRARDLLKRVLSVDPGLAEAHTLFADVVIRQDRDWTEGEKHHKIALRLKPDSADVHDGYATSLLAPTGRMEEALTENAIARQLDPFSPHIERSHLFILMLGRRIRDVELESTRILEARPDDGYARVMLALALQGQRRRADALVEYQRLFESDPSLQHEAYVACLQAVSGDRKPAQDLLRKLRHAAPDSRFVPAMTLAWLHLHLGEVEEALSEMERACTNREYEVVLGRVGFGFDGVRDHPQFRAILKRVGLG